MLGATRGDVIGRAQGQSRHRSLSSAALRKIDIFFDERPAYSKEYRTIVSFSVSDFAEPMSNSLLSLPAAAGERFRSLEATPASPSSIVSLDWPFDDLGFLSEKFREMLFYVVRS